MGEIVYSIHIHGGCDAPAGPWVSGVGGNREEADEEVAVTRMARGRRRRK